MPLRFPLTSLRWRAKVLMIQMHRPLHEALSASSPEGRRDAVALFLLWVPAFAGITGWSGVGGGRPFDRLRANGH